MKEVIKTRGKVNEIENKKRNRKSVKTKIGSLEDQQY